MPVAAVGSKRAALARSERKNLLILVFMARTYALRKRDRELYVDLLRAVDFKETSSNWTVDRLAIADRLGSHTNVMSPGEI